MPYSGSRFPLETDYATLQHTWTLTPALINNLRAGFVRNSVFTSNEGSELGDVLPGIGITNTLDPQGISGISLQGYAGFGRAAGNIGNVDNSYQLDDGMYYSRGTHSYQFGASLRYRRTWQQNANASAVGGSPSSRSSRRSFTERAGSACPAGADRESFADFLLGTPATGQMIGLPLIPYRFTQVNPYLQDTWKVTRNFTLNYGIAWFLSTVPEPVGWAARLPHGLDENTGLLTVRRAGPGGSEDPLGQLEELHAPARIRVEARLPEEHRDPGGSRNLLCRYQADRGAVRDGRAALQHARDHEQRRTRIPSRNTCWGRTSSRRPRTLALDDSYPSRLPTAPRRLCCARATEPLT